MILWGAIECIKRNGIITGYVVEFQEQGGEAIAGVLVDMRFSSTGLTPGTPYIFRVAGVNVNGTGPFTDNITIFSADDSMHATHHANSINGTFYDLCRTWSSV